MTRRSRWLLVLMAVCTGLPSAIAGAQSVDRASAMSPRSPRFLLRVAGRPVPIAPARVALLGRRVDAELDGVTLAAAIQEVATRAGVEVVFSRDVAGLDRRVRLHAQGLTLAAALTELLFDQELDVVIAPGERLVIATRARGDEAPRDTSGAVQGAVTDATSHEPLAGAQVVVTGTDARQVTGDDGRYALHGVPAGRRVVEVRRLGYRAETRVIDVRAGETVTLDIALVQSASSLDEVIVAGNYVEASRREAPVPVTTLAGAEIHRPSRNRIDQLFRGDIPGVVGYDNGAAALGLVAYVRGSASLDDANLLKVYVDGVETPANFLVSGIDLSGIERVELLRGPEASTIYGSNASGGVLLLFTKNGRRSAPRLSGSAAAGVTASDFVDGTPLTMEHRLAVSGGADNFTYSFGGSYDSYGDVLPQANWRQVGAYGRTVLTQGALRFALTAGLSHRTIGASTYPALATLGIPALSAPRNDDFHLTNQLVGATITYAASPRWQHVLTIGYTGIGFDENNYAPRNAYDGDTLRIASLETDDQLTVRYVTSADRPLSATITSRSTAGAELSRRTHDYYEGDGLDDPQSGSSAQFDYIEAYRITNDVGMFAQQVFGFRDRLFLTGGLRAEHNSNVGSGEGLIWSPRVGVAYTIDLGDRLELKPRVSYGRSIRPPQPGQAGAARNAVQIQRSNPRLRSEVQSGIDAGFDLDYGSGALTLEATYFDQRATDLIGLAYLGDPTAAVVETQYQNVGRVTNTGVELALGVNRGPWTLRGSFSTVRSRVARLAPDYSGDQRVGDAMLYVPRRSGGGTVGFHFGPALAASSGRQALVEVGVTYIGRRRSLDLLGYYACAYGVGPCLGSLRAYQTDLPAFAKVRVGFTHPITEGSDLFVNVENLTNDQRGEYVAVSPSRGRTVLVGIRFGE
ncbi:MAG TPA: TonB-dependent receptor [Gemmatimonadaceae bacterium]